MQKKLKAIPFIKQNIKTNGLVGTPPFACLNNSCTYTIYKAGREEHFTKQTNFIDLPGAVCASTIKYLHSLRSTWALLFVKL